MMRRICVGLLTVALLLMMLPIASNAAASYAARCNLRLRKSASSSSDTLIVIPGGTEITPQGNSGGWTKTSYNGHTGYVSTSYLMEMTQTGYYPLKEGDESPYVTEVQKRLIALGYLSGTADGKFDATMKKAITEFQRVNSIKQDGIAGGETQRTLFSDVALSAVGAVQTTASGTPAQSTAASATQATQTAAPSATILRKGDRGEDVKTLQLRLIELGYLSGKADGIFGTATEVAVVSFQKRSSLTADGKAGKVTQNLLFAAAATPAEGASSTLAAESTATAATVEYKTLKRGMTSNEVKKLQERLKELGYISASPTGFYGSATQLAVEKFQKANNLKVDGIAGSATQNLLYGTGVKNQTPETPETTTNYPTLKEGMKSAAVTTMQKKLQALGYLKADATGYFGTATKSAVIAFQKASQLTADGIAGNATLRLLYGDSATAAGSAGTATGGGAGKISGPGASSVKLLHWFNTVKPALKSNSIVQVYDPASGYGFKLKALALGNHFDSEPATADDTLYMNAAFGGVTTWTPKPVWVQLPNGVWTLATMHNTPHLSGSVANNNFNGHLCMHFLRDMAECSQNDPNYGVQHQKAIREAWKKLTGQTIN